MVKTKTKYTCQACGAISPKWSGQCGGCGAWNQLIEEVALAKNISERFQSYAGDISTDVITKLSEVSVTPETRIPTGSTELDRVLGEGLVTGSVVLMGGDPGIGKSTLLLQTLTHLAKNQKALYVTGEESLQQISLRAKRLGLSTDDLLLLTETHVERIIDLAITEKPDVMVVDSIQTMFSDVISSAPGGVGQVRESAAKLVRFAKKTGTALFLVGHVTKEGALAGPRVLEHMVDTVLYFEGESDSRYRVLRAVKNRFGAVNELGVFAMAENGLREVSNPSAIFLTRGQEDVPGSCVMVTWEGSRPLLVEVQALVDNTHLGNPRRVTVGMEQNRLAMLLAVMHRHGGIATYDQDVFVNVVGGIRLSETGADLALAAAILSSLRNKPLPQDLVVFGEMGLAGELRPVHRGQERLLEASKHGFKKAIVPKANAPKKKLADIEIQGVNSVADALDLLA